MKNFGQSNLPGYPGAHFNKFGATSKLTNKWEIKRCSVYSIKSSYHNNKLIAFNCVWGRTKH